MNTGHSYQRILYYTILCILIFVELNEAGAATAATTTTTTTSLPAAAGMRTYDYIHHTRFVVNPKG